MGFQLKDFNSIALSMINRAKATQGKVTDWNIGSVARTLLESPAIEIEEFYHRMLAGILDAIPTAIYYGFDFALVSASAARGVVNISFGVPIEESFVIPVGTAFTASATGSKYLAVQDVGVPVGASSISVLVECTSTGSVGNVPVGGVDSVSGFTLPRGAVVSSNAITSGTDGETEEERKSRFAAYVQTLARGTNGAVEYAARSAVVKNTSGDLVEYVSRTGFVEVPGTMDVFIYGAGQAASGALIAEAQKIIDGYWSEEAQTFIPGYRPVGVRVRVFRMVEVPVDALLTVEMFSGVAFTADIRDSILSRVSAEIMSVRAGGVLYVENIVESVLAVAGVKAVRTNLRENVLCPDNSALVAGDIRVVAGDA